MSPLLVRALDNASRAQDQAWAERESRATDRSGGVNAVLPPPAEPTGATLSVQPTGLDGGMLPVIVTAWRASSQVK